MKYKFWTVILIGSNLISLFFLINEYRKPKLKFNPIGNISDTIDVKNDPIIGNSNAKNTLIVFSNYTCEYCFKFQQEAIPYLKEKYINKGYLNVVYKDYPPRMSQSSILASQLGELAWENNKFEDCQGLLYTAEKYDSSFVYQYAMSLKIDTSSIWTKLNSDEIYGDVMRDVILSENLFVKGTPTFVLNNYVFAGYTDVESFDKMISPYLK